MSQKLLLVLPLPAYRKGSQVLIDAQAHNGLRLWLNHFDTLILACPALDVDPPTGCLPIVDERITFVALPVAYTPLRFASSLFTTMPILKKIIAESDYLHFAIGGLFGDWAAIGAIIASWNDRPFAVWTDRVESQVTAFQATSKRGLRKFYSSAVATLMKIYERQIIKMSAVGLFHGMECYEAYSPYSTNPHLVHDIHLGREHQITDEEIATRLDRTGPIRIAYAGRVHRDKGVFDWIDALSSAAKEDIDFQAVWFGDGPEIDNARHSVVTKNLSDRIEFPGAVSNHLSLIARLRSFDFFMFCHKTQESPRCLIEALICGLPLVGYETPYPRDLIKEHEGGILSPFERPELLPRSIRKFCMQRNEITRNAQLDGKLFDAESVFRHRSDLMKESLLQICSLTRKTA
jgi:colanic acid/amylovoran biosynthesis glycosyltransferase